MSWPLSASPCLRRKTAGWYFIVVRGVRDAGIQAVTRDTDQSGAGQVVLLFYFDPTSPLSVRKSRTSDTDRVSNNF